MIILFFENDYPTLVYYKWNSQVKKIEQLFNYYEIKYEKRIFIKKKPTIAEIEDLLIHSEEDIYSILSEQSQILKNRKAMIDDMLFSDFKQYLITHPQLLSKPIAIGQRKMVVGYSEDELTTFKNRQHKQVLRRKAIMRAYSSFENVGI